MREIHYAELIEAVTGTPLPRPSRINPTWQINGVDVEVFPPTSEMPGWRTRCLVSGPRPRSVLGRLGGSSPLPAVLDFIVDTAYPGVDPRDQPPLPDLDELHVEAVEVMELIDGLAGRVNDLIARLDQARRT